MAKTWVHSIVGELQKERVRLESELRRVSAALSAFGTVYARGGNRGPVKRKKPVISAAGRRRIAAAQRARWAKVRAAKAGK
jgi:hypothetical protein